MKAVVFDKELKLVSDYAKPVPKKGEALIRITLAGICNTDFEITKGYMGYVGILGHEAVGIVEEINDENKSLLGKRVVAEISYGCKDPNCSYCAEKLYRHCPNRHTLGIWRKDGCFAEYMTMPLEVLFEVPDNVTDEVLFILRIKGSITISFLSILTTALSHLITDVDCGIVTLKPLLLIFPVIFFKSLVNLPSNKLFTILTPLDFSYIEKSLSPTLILLTAFLSSPLRFTSAKISPDVISKALFNSVGANDLNKGESGNFSR